MSNNRFKLTPAVYLFLTKDDQILLLQRANTGFMDGWYSLPAGHVDGNETAREAIARESDEEIGLKINPLDIKMNLTMHSLHPTRESVDWFLTADKYTGEIENKEPHKCSELKFYPINDLPENTIPYIKHAIECYQNDITYAEWGWDLNKK